MKKFNVSIPRKMYWSNEIPKKTICPECHCRLENEYHTYVVMVKTSELETLMAGNDDGHFCHKCPVVVLDYDKFAEIGSIGTSHKSFDFVVLGIVDLDAVDEDKRHLPLGEDKNPIPLVEFINSPRQNEGKQINESFQKEAKKKKKHKKKLTQKSKRKNRKR